jgi:S-layer protein
VTGSDAVTIGGLTTSAASETLTNSGSSTLAVGVLAGQNLASLTLNGNVAADLMGDTVATGVTVNGTTDNSAVTVDMSLSGAASGATDSITLGNGTDSVNDLAAAGATVNIRVGNGGNSTTANTITVGDANSTIMAGSGVNTILAGNGTNTITVGNGNDIITAGNGNNTIIAGSGNDTISVGAGLNAITVGAGADTLQFTTGSSDGSGSVYSTITGAQAGDTLAFAGTGTGIILNQVTGVPTTTSFATLLNDAITASPAAGDMGWFQYTGTNGATNTYVVDNATGGASFGAGDYVVALSGAVNLTGSTVSGNTLTLGSHVA